MNELTAAMASLKAALDISKSFLSLRDEALIQQKVIELQAIIIQAQQSALSAQQQQESLMNNIKILDTEIKKLGDWSAEKEKYELVAPQNGVPLYHLRISDGRPSHYLCSRCFEDGSKSMINRSPLVESGFYIHQCPRCSTKYHFEKYAGPAQ